MLTKQESIKLCRFLQCAQGDWRNALYIECQECPYSSAPCSGYLLTSDSEGRPVVYPADRLSELTGEDITKDECAGTLSREAFCRLYARRLLWDADSENQCGVRQVFLKLNEHA